MDRVEKEVRYGAPGASSGNSLRLSRPIASPERRELGPVTQAELGEQVRDMAFHSLAGEEERGCHVSVAGAAGDQRRDPLFSLGERRGLASRAPTPGVDA